jgi:hypothetical protein
VSLFRLGGRAQAAGRTINAARLTPDLCGDAEAVARCRAGRIALITQKMTFLHAYCAICLKNGHFL